MLDELVTQMPNVGDLLALTRPQLDSVLLKCIAQRSPGTVFEDEIVGLFPIGMRANYQQRLAADNALMEAWQRLKSAGLIMQAPGQAARVMTITVKGRDAAVAVRFEEIAVRQMLRPEMLHSALQGAVYENFSGGNYDTAVRDAYVQVEIAVRDAVDPPASLVGVKLMREAFNPHTGKLTKMALSMPERERMADLFAGAIGTFKNPLSHRKVGNIEPQPVIEELMFASCLLRFIKP